MSLAKRACSLRDGERVNPEKAGCNNALGELLPQEVIFEMTLLLDAAGLNSLLRTSRAWKRLISKSFVKRWRMQKTLLWETLHTPNFQSHLKDLCLDQLFERLCTREKCLLVGHGLADELLLDDWDTESFCLLVDISEHIKYANDTPEQAKAAAHSFCQSNFPGITIHDFAQRDTDFECLTMPSVRAALIIDESQRHAQWQQEHKAFNTKIVLGFVKVPQGETLKSVFERECRYDLHKAWYDGKRLHYVDPFRMIQQDKQRINF